MGSNKSMTNVQPGKRVNKLDSFLSAKLLFRWYLILLLIFTAGRSVFLIYYFDRVESAGSDVWLSLLYGLRMDTISASLLLLVPAFILHLSPVLISRFSNQLLRIYFLIVLLVAIYMENATLPFINEYDVRPNVIFINYLKYPREVLGTIWAVYKLELFISFCFMALATYWFFRSNKTSFIDALKIPLWIRLLLLLPVILVLVMGVRSSFGHRAANPSDAVFSENRLLNEISKNSIYSVAYAAYSEMKHGGSAKKYGAMEKAEAFERVANRLHITSAGDEESPFRRLEKSHFKRDKPKNLVIFLQESIGAQFVGALHRGREGEQDVTPNINALSKESIFFTRLYSNGTRSIRGISGVVAGFLSTPGKGVVKRNLSQKDFFTVAQLLKPLGYKSSFFYGGESRFDNMKSWFSGNGFDEIYDQATFSKDVFHGTWGVDDVTVAEKANDYYKRLFENNENFVSVIFSTTNHSPFDFPPGKIELVEGVPEKSVENAIKYADFAIGHFIELAKNSGYYQDTVIMVISDHNIRVYGDDLVPVDMFHVPGMILGGGIQPKIYNELVSHPDTLATALDLLGVDLKYPVLGRSVFSDKKAGVTLLQYHDIYGLRYKNEIAILQPGKPAETYRVDDNDRITLTEHNAELEKDALAFIITLDLLYSEQSYR
jgi:phosphoglycerol transferase MdoB-like AlkP superfamily enzyme